MSDVGVLRLRSDQGGKRRLMGVPFLGAGLGAWTAVAHVGGFDGLLLGVFGFLGLVFTALGSLLVFGRVETLLDRERGTVTELVEVFVTLVRRQRRFGDVTRVVLLAEAHTDSSADDFDRQVYRVRLQGPHQESESVDLVTEREYAQARAHALATSEFLGLPLEDYTSDAPDERVPRPVAAPSPPPGPRLTRDQGLGATTISVAPPRFHTIRFLYLAVGVSFLAGVHFFAAPEFLAGMTHPRARLLFGAFLHGVFGGVPFVTLAGPALRSLTTRVRVSLDAQGVTVRHSSLFGWRHTSLLPGDIQKVDLAASARRLREPGLSEGSVVRILGRGGRIVEIDSLLDGAEAPWLRDEIQHHVTG